MIVIVGYNFKSNKILIDKLNELGLREFKLSTTMPHKEKFKHKYNYVDEKDVPNKRMLYFRNHKDGSKTFLDGEKTKNHDFIMLDPWELYPIAKRNQKLKLSIIYIADKTSGENDSYQEFEQTCLSGSLEEIYPNIMRVYDLSIKDESDVNRFIKEQNNLKGWY